MIPTRLTTLLGIGYPVIQGGMVRVADWRLASAVSNAGGLGVLGPGSMRRVNRPACYGPCPGWRNFSWNWNGTTARP